MKKDDFEEYDEYNEYEEVSEKEQEIIDTYMDKKMNKYIKDKEKKNTLLKKSNDKILKKELENDDLEEYEIEDDFVEKKKEKKPFKFNKKKVLKVTGIIALVIVLLSVLDVLFVSVFNIGPFFAIPIHTYEDGGTKEYIGLGYKVIKYNQVQGRRDKEIGTWNLKYRVEPIYIDAVDLAIEFHDNEKEAYKKYKKEFLVVTGTLKEVDSEERKIVISFEDEGEKYNLDVVCKMDKDQNNMNILEPKYEITAMGTMTDYDYKTKTKPSTIYLSNCFAEQ